MKCRVLPLSCAFVKEFGERLEVSLFEQTIPYGQ